MDDEPNQFFAKTSGRVSAVILCLVAGAILAVVYCGTQFPWGLTWESAKEGYAMTLAAPIVGPFIAYQYRDYPSMWISLAGWVFVPLAIRFVRRANRATCIGMIIGVMFWFGSGMVAVRRILNF